jgi:alkylhydroperoxidase/carboxymuconolactone decarboxylase family protein YurZ
MTTNPWTSGVLSRKLVELIGIMLNTSCTNLNSEGTRRHIRAALKAGAPREEILWVLKSATLGALHSLSRGAPILLEEAKEAGAKPAHRGRGEPTPSCDQNQGYWQMELGVGPLFGA